MVNSEWANAKSYQRAACPWNNGALNCAFGWTSVENSAAVEGKDYAYKTVFEIFTPYEWAVTEVYPIHADMPLWISAVAETGWDFLLNFGQDATLPTTLTDAGFVRK